MFLGKFNVLYVARWFFKCGSCLPVYWLFNLPPCQQCIRTSGPKALSFPIRGQKQQINMKCSKWRDKRSEVTKYKYSLRNYLFFPTTFDFYSLYFDTNLQFLLRTFSNQACYWSLNAFEDIVFLFSVIAGRLPNITRLFSTVHIM